MRGILLGAVVAGTVVTILTAGKVGRLWNETFAQVPFARCAAARIRYTLQLFRTILLASIGALLVWALFPAILEGDEYARVPFAVGLWLLGDAIYSIVTWIRRLRASA